MEHSNAFPMLKWPPRSPDLNPIEHLWDVVWKKIQIGSVLQTSLQELRNHNKSMDPNSERVPPECRRVPIMNKWGVSKYQMVSNSVLGENT